MSSRLHKQLVTRRQTLGLAGLAGAAYVTGLGRGGDAAEDLAGIGRAEPASAQLISCTLAPEVTEGPYFVDDKLNRSNIRSNSDGSGAQPGVALTLTLRLLQIGSGGACTPYGGATVDLWHANASGVYSGVQSAQNPGGTDTDFLRGLQLSDANGSVTFQTLFPHDYQGRAVHMHFKVRTFTGSSQTYESTSQLFFSDSDTAAVYATEPYSSGGSTPDTSNSEDNIYGQTGGVTVVPLSGSPSGGYTGALDIGLSGLPGTGADTGTDTGDEDTSDATVGARLLAVRLRRNKKGGRTLRVKLDLDERMTVGIRILRNGKTVAKKRRENLGKGTRIMSVPVARTVRRGSARLRATFRDASGNVKTVGRSVRVPDKLS